MGQVPDSTVSTVTTRDSIVLVGEGRLAKALRALAPFFIDEKPLLSVTREDLDRNGHTIFNRASHVWLAISDPSIVPFTQEFLCHEAHASHALTAVHFAGSLPTLNVGRDGWHVTVHAAHPLSSFARDRVMGWEEFRAVPFALSPESPRLSALLPGCANPTFTIRDEDRIYYHTLCAVAGNFTVLLWETIARHFAHDLELPPALLNTYQQQVFDNLRIVGSGLPLPASVLTGPIARGDDATIRKHIDTLMQRNEASLAQIYQSFVQLNRTNQNLKTLNSENPHKGTRREVSP